MKTTKELMEQVDTIIEQTYKEAFEAGMVAAILSTVKQQKELTFEFKRQDLAEKAWKKFARKLT